MTARRPWAAIGVGAVLLVAIVVGTIAAGGEDTEESSADLLVACATEHPQAGGKVYCYVFRQPVTLQRQLAVLENDAPVATFNLRDRTHSRRPFAMRVAVADPVVGGQVYCFLAHPSGWVYVFRGAEYVGVHGLGAHARDI